MERTAVDQLLEIYEHEKIGVLRDKALILLKRNRKPRSGSSITAVRWLKSPPEAGSGYPRHLLKEALGYDRYSVRKSFDCCSPLQEAWDEALN